MLSESALIAVPRRVFLRISHNAAKSSNEHKTIKISREVIVKSPKSCVLFFSKEIDFVDEPKTASINEEKNISRTTEDIKSTTDVDFLFLSGL